MSLVRVPKSVVDWGLLGLGELEWERCFPEAGFRTLRLEKGLAFVPPQGDEKIIRWSDLERDLELHYLDECYWHFVGWMPGGQECLIHRRPPQGGDALIFLRPSTRRSKIIRLQDVNSLIAVDVLPDGSIATITHDGYKWGECLPVQFRLLDSAQLRAKRNELKAIISEIEYRFFAVCEYDSAPLCDIEFRPSEKAAVITLPYHGNARKRVRADFRQMPRYAGDRPMREIRLLGKKQCRTCAHEWADAASGGKPWRNRPRFAFKCSFTDPDVSRLIGLRRPIRPEDG